MTHIKIFLIGCLLSLAGVGSVLCGQLPPILNENDFIKFDKKQAALGQLLFYDKILSGNRNISCATCHHHEFHGGDGLSLGIGEGGEGIGPKRTPGDGRDRIAKRIPRNAPALWNLGAKEIKLLFHDGRLSRSDLYDNGFNSPAEERLPKELTSLLAAQALFPLASQFEMAGNPRENEVARAAHDRIDRVWPILAKRVRAIPQYREQFVEAFDHIKRPEQVTIVEIAQAIAAFIGMEWQSFDAPFDAFLAGDDDALTLKQKRGLELFYGKANCASCHKGSLFSDQEFYALALPPFGPGRTRLFDPYARDVGRMGETDRLEDAYRFRTPFLRNIALSGPYGHNGAYDSLDGIVRHHLNPLENFAKWTPTMAKLPKVPWLQSVDFLTLDDSREMARVRAHVDIKPVAIDDKEISDIIAFLNSLTGKTVNDLPFGRPKTVPSGLPVD